MPLRFQLFGLIILARALEGCATDCEGADRRVLDKYEECGVTLDADDEGRTEATDATQVECTEELGQRRDAFARCAEEASCAAITGKDQAGHAQYTACISGTQ